MWSAKAAAGASRALGRGGGTAISGLVALTVYPGIARELARGVGHGSVVVTGTNGKTTTSRMIAETARAAGLRPLANTSGSNLMRGIAATLTAAASGARLDGGSDRIGVFEVDEATVPAALAELAPRVVVFNNLFRDQLDRYGEVEAVADLWRQALVSAPVATTLVLNADDPSVASLGEGRENVVYFGVEDAALDRGRREHAADAVTCVCGAAYEYSVSYYGHLGHWRCPTCGRSRPAPSVYAKAVDANDARRVGFEMCLGGKQTRVELGLGGLYNVYNALAAAAASLALGLPRDALERALASFSAAFGRQESFDVAGQRVDVFLGKNPAGLNQVLATVALDPSRKSALIALNDGIADGRDISWVWDADFEVAAGKFERVVVSGLRAEEMALRLKYAEWDETTLVIERDIVRALDVALESTAAGECLTVVPTYTAMLEVRELLAKRAGRAPFWRE